MVERYEQVPREQESARSLVPKLVAMSDTVAHYASDSLRKLGITFADFEPTLLRAGKALERRENLDKVLANFNGGKNGAAEKVIEITQRLV